MNFSRAFLGVLVTSFVASTAIAANAQYFPDVPTDHDNARAIYIGQQAGFFSGYPDGTFGPTRPINRAELLKIIVMTLGSDFTAGQLEPLDCFPDVHKNDWFGPYVCFAARQGWVRGYADGFFRPEHTVNLAEALKMFLEIRQMQIIDRRFPAEGYARDAWFTPYVDTALWDDVVSEETIWGGTGNAEGLDKPLTRMRAAELLYRTLLHEGRVIYSLDAGECKALKDVVSVTLKKYDLKYYTDSSVVSDFDLIGTMKDGTQCILSIHDNPYAAISRYWTSRTMFLVSPDNYDEILESAPIVSGKIYLRNGHETAGLGNDVWELDTSTMKMSLTKRIATP
jgi:hypothetical protein